MTDPVYVFIASAGGSPTRQRVLWRLERADAMRLCSDSRTSNRTHMLCWTAPENTGERGTDWQYIKDSGYYDVVLADLGITPTKENA
jgi:hypothetical protein